MRKSKLLGFFILIIIVICSCNSGKEKVIEGDLYFYRFDLYRIFDWPDSTMTEFENNVLHANLDTFNRKDKDFVDLVKYAINKKLTRQPYVWILCNNKEFMLFLDQQDYDKVKDYTWYDLTAEHKKIHIKVKAYNISYKELKALKCSQILDLKKIEGETKYK